MATIKTIQRKKGTAYQIGYTLHGIRSWLSLGSDYTKIERIVFYAGLNRWERLIQNLRSSRAIEIAREYGVLAEAEWIGHSPQTAKDHYLHVLDADFEHAATVDKTIPKDPEIKNDHKNDHTQPDANLHKLTFRDVF